jgi:CheY-like chemotaxis protein
MLIEDDAIILSKLREQFDKYFHNITPFQNGNKAFAELEKNARQYDVVITDMELLEGNLDNERQGIDILELCEKEFPFIVTRVISALPRYALKSLIGKGLAEIIFKSGTVDSVIPPFENLVDFVSQIDKEVKKKRQLRKMLGPEISWWGKYLTKQLYITKIENPDAFNSIWNNAINTANRFVNKEFDTLKDIEKISVEFKQVKEASSNPESGWEIIELLLTHRLIALWFASTNGWDEFYYLGNGDKAYTNLQGFQPGLQSKTFKSYFNTFLGLSVESNTDNSNKCRLLARNLFSEELEWLSQIKSNNLDTFLLREHYDDLLSMLSKLIKDYNGKTIDDDISFGDAMNLLDDFIENYPDEKRITSRHNNLKNVFTIDLDDFYETLPSEAKSRIDSIKQDIFSV